MFLLCYYSAGLFVVLLYLVPAAILSWRDRESAWERGWVEFFYLTFQILLSWGELRSTSREFTLGAIAD